MRCAHCDRRFDAREETILHEKDGTLRRFHPGCYTESEKASGGTARWSGGPPYDDFVRLDEEDFKKVVAQNGDAFNLQHLLELEQEERDRDAVTDLLRQAMDERDDALDEVEQLA